jgi:hypothetical protein
MIKPPGFDPNKKYPLRFLIHEGPQGSWGNDWTYRWNAELFAANGYVVVMINFHGSTGYGQKFTDSISGDWDGKPYVAVVHELGIQRSAVEESRTLSEIFATHLRGGFQSADARGARPARLPA